MRVLIVEDEPLVARRLVRMLGALLGANSHIDQCDALGDAMQALQTSRYDALFLDLNLSGQDGFRLLTEALVGAHQTVVVSANTDRAMEAFELGVLDFVPKPFDESRLRITVDRLLQREPRGGPGTMTLAVRVGRRTQTIPVERICAIHGAGNYSELELESGRKLLHDKSLDQLAALLPDRFQRIHRSHIANMDMVVRLRTIEGSRYRVELSNESELPVSRQRIRDLRKLLT
ncbi:MAG: LytTR family DNA-binding domain-containing protein [Pseudomonadota bacterium]